MKKVSSWHIGVAGEAFAAAQFARYGNLATPAEIAHALHDSRAGLGETVLRENHVWGERASAAGTVDKLPEEWLFTEERARQMLDTYA